MNELWNRSFELLRKHIVLWVPCSLAGVIMLALRELQKAEIHWLVTFFSTQHSVLGGEVPTADWALAQRKAMMAGAPLGFVKQFVEVCLFVVALAATKNLVEMVLSARTPDLKAAVRAIFPRSREVMLLSLKYMAVMGFFLGILFVLSSSPFTSERIHELLLSKALIYVLGLVVQICLAWLLVPAAIRLLRPTGSPAISAEGRKMGTALAVVTAAGTMVLQYLVNKAEARLILEKHWQNELIAVLNTVIINTPQVFLFIALALLAIQGSEDEKPLARSPEMSWSARLFDWVRRAREWGNGPI